MTTLLTSAVLLLTLIVLLAVLVLLLLLLVEMLYWGFGGIREKQPLFRLTQWVKRRFDIGEKEE